MIIHRIIGMLIIIKTKLTATRTTILERIVTFIPIPFAPIAASTIRTIKVKTIISKEPFNPHKI